MVAARRFLLTRGISLPWDLRSTAPTTILCISPRDTRDFIQRAFFDARFKIPSLFQKRAWVTQSFPDRKRPGRTPPDPISVSHFCVILSAAKDLARSA
jgi:hypothetical protein